MKGRIRRVSRCWQFIGILFFLTVILFGRSMPAEAAAGTVTVQFGAGKTDSFDNVYPDLTLKVKEGAKILLPKKNKADAIGYWLDIRTGILYKSGKEYKVTRNSKFTIRFVSKKTITFCSPSTGKTFSALTKVYGISKHAIMPDFPKEHKAYGRFLGWSRSRYAKVPSYLPGEKVRIYKNTKFYAVIGTKTEAEKAYIYLRYTDGKLYQKLKVQSGLKFPSVDLKNGSTVIGWSTVKNKKASAEYMEEEKIPARAGTYYMVTRAPKNDPVKGVENLNKVTRHSYVYIVGDSRTAYMKGVFGKNPSKTRLIGNPGRGYQWLIGKDETAGEGAYQILLKELKQKKSTQYGRHPAVVFNLGVNDMGNAAAYAAYYKKIAPVLKKTYNCDLYFMSVNPLNRQMFSNVRIKLGKTKPGTLNSRTNAKVAQFNAILKRNLAGTYQYIDTNQYLNESGWTTWADSGSNVRNYADGLHYSKSTYEKIFNYTLSVTETL